MLLMKTARVVTNESCNLGHSPCFEHLFLILRGRPCSVSLARATKWEELWKQCQCILGPISSVGSLNLLCKNEL